MERNKAKALANRIITVTSPNEVNEHFSNMLAMLAAHNLKQHGFYAFTQGEERVFVEVV